MKKVTSGNPVKLMNNGDVVEVFCCTNPVVLNKNNEMVSKRISVAVTLAGMKVCERNEAFAGVGSTSCIAGGVLSMVKLKTVSSALLAPKVSVAVKLSL